MIAIKKTTLIILAITVSTLVFGQTKKIAHKSHSGSEETYLAKNYMDNLGLPEPQLDSIRFINDSIVVEYGTEFWRHSNKSKSKTPDIIDTVKNNYYCTNPNIPTDSLKNVLYYKRRVKLIDFENRDSLLAIKMIKSKTMKAVEFLATSIRITSARVGEGNMQSKETKAFNEIFQSKHRAFYFRKLFKIGNGTGKFYALIGLSFLKRIKMNELNQLKIEFNSKTYKDVTVQYGCKILKNQDVKKVLKIWLEEGIPKRLWYTDILEQKKHQTSKKTNALNTKGGEEENIIKKTNKIPVHPIGVMDNEKKKELIPVIVLPNSLTYNKQVLYLFIVLGIVTIMSIFFFVLLRIKRVRV